MSRKFTDPTPKREWVKVGDECESQMGMKGKVQRILKRTHGLHSARVLWENGYSGVVTITTIRRVRTS
jgi:hypothetical protein